MLRVLRSRRVGRNVTQADTKIALAHLRRAGVGKLETSRDVTPVVPRPEVRGLPPSASAYISIPLWQRSGKFFAVRLHLFLRSILPNWGLTIQG